MTEEKIVIYQLLPRLFGNKNTHPIPNGSRTQNGCGKFNDITNKALAEIRKLGANYIWYTGIIEHAITQGYPKENIPNGNPLIIKGKAGSPYAIKDYYDVNPDLAVHVSNRMNEFHDLVKRTHKNGLKLIIDFVPNHLARAYESDKKPENIDDFGKNDNPNKAFSPSNNFYYIPNQKLELPKEQVSRFSNSSYFEYPAKATGNDQFSANLNQNDWYETVKLNYGVDYTKQHATHFSPIPDTWLKMKDILLYWARKGINGFRCDMAEMVPVEFWKWAIATVKQEFPEIIFIAEIYRPELYESYIRQANFDYLYDKMGLYDTLKAVIRSELPAKSISNCWKNLHGLDQYMLRFLENHDEQRIASRFFAANAQKALPAMTALTCLHKGPVMIYFGQELGEAAEGESGFSGDDGRTTIFDYWHVPEHQKWMNSGLFNEDLLSEKQIQLRKSYTLLLKLAQFSAIQKGEFYDLMWQNTDFKKFDSNKIYAFLRHTKNQVLLIVCNFDDKKQFPHVIIPSHALEILNVPRPMRMSFRDIFSEHLSQISSEELIHKGIKLKIDAYGSSIWEILST